MSVTQDVNNFIERTARLRASLQYADMMTRRVDLSRRFERVHWPVGSFRHGSHNIKHLEQHDDCRRTSRVIVDLHFESFVRCVTQ